MSLTDATENSLNKSRLSFPATWLLVMSAVFTFTFMHLVDAFIQSDLQLHSGYTCSLVHVFPGNRTHNLLRSWCNALPLSHTGKHFSLKTKKAQTHQAQDFKLTTNVLYRRQMIQLLLHCNQMSQKSYLQIATQILTCPSDWDCWAHARTAKNRYDIGTLMKDDFTTQEQYKP